MMTCICVHMYVCRWVTMLRLIIRMIDYDSMDFSTSSAVKTFSPLLCNMLRVESGYVGDIRLQLQKQSSYNENSTNARSTDVCWSNRNAKHIPTCDYAGIRGNYAGISGNYAGIIGNIPAGIMNNFFKKSANQNCRRGLVKGRDASEGAFYQTKSPFC